MGCKSINPIEREREKINQIDKSIVELLDRRFEVVESITKIKKEMQMPVFQAKREQEVFEKIASLSEHPSNCVEIFKKIMEESKQFQERLLCK